MASIALDREDLPGLTIPGPDPTIVVTAPKIQCTIVASLTGVDFTIAPGEPWAQSFVDKRVLTWQWQVTPLRAGAGLKLLLHLRPEINEEGRPPRPGADETVKADIDVNTKELSLIDRTVDPITGIFGNPAVQFLVPGGGVVLLWAWRQLRRRGRSAAATADG